MALEIDFSPSYDITYYPFGKRLIFDVVQEDDYKRSVNDGEQGRLIFSRFDETFMIINLLERDRVTKVESHSHFQGLSGCAVKNPHPAEIDFTIKDGIY